ncbi:hypothetical protein Q8A67_002959 [Cirrhinus molitorella]|uniref:Uncharacterized protein n=1 Tax=Cirrhinus molitorella TaxID=172907 RepID=A0AA88QCI4_9TELE|nr:hypothetical protein Q8A67_002959 [Cirrhinus molitorella]
MTKDCLSVYTLSCQPTCAVNEIAAPVAVKETDEATVEEQTVRKPCSARDYNFTLSPELEMGIAEGGPQLIDITPIDQALQALDQMPALANLPVVRSWTIADTALCLTTTIGYALTLGLSFFLYKRINGMQESVSRCMAAFLRTFKRHPGKQGTPTEPEPTLIEIDTLPVHCRTEDE